MPVTLPISLHKMYWTAAVWAVRSGNWVTVVSGNDHIHMRNSMHYADRALDFHSSDMDGLNEWLNYHGYATFWQVAGHYAHVHGQTLAPEAARRLAAAALHKLLSNLETVDYRIEGETDETVNHLRPSVPWQTAAGMKAAGYGI